MFRMKMTNRVMCGIVSATVFFSAATFSVTAKENITVTLNGQILSFDVPPQIINDRTMVPLRAIFEALGASVDWDEGTKTVTSSKDGTTITLTIDSNTMYVNGNAVALDSPACIIDGRTLVPVRAISEAYNTNVDWNGDTRTVTITSVNTAPQTPSVAESSYSRLQQEIINKGIYVESSGSYGLMEHLNDEITVYVLAIPSDPSAGLDDYIGITLNFVSNGRESNVYLILRVNANPTLSIKSDYETVRGEFTNGKFVITSSSLLDDGSYMDLASSSVNLINVYLLSEGFSTSLADFGIPVS